MDNITIMCKFQYVYGRFKFHFKELNVKITIMLGVKNLDQVDMFIKYKVTLLALSNMIDNMEKEVYVRAN